MKNHFLRYVRFIAAAVTASVMICSVANAQNEFATPTQGKTVVGVGNLCLNSSGQMVPMFDAAGTYRCAGTGIPVTGTLTATTTEKSTAAAPSYVDGTSNPFSGDLLGNLRTTMPSVGANGSTVKTNSSLMGVSDGTNQQQLVAPIGLGDGINGNNMVAGGLYGYNGATWDRIRADITNGIWVQIKGTVPLPTGAATAAAQTGVQTTVAPGTAPASANIGGCQYVAAGVAPTDAQTMATQCGPNGRALVAVGTSGQFANTPTVQNASYASGNCIGGFNAVTVTDYNGQSGFVTNFRVLSLGGSTPTVTLYLFDSNPSSSTCTDKSTFTLNSADVDKMIASPTAGTLAAPTGTTVSFASIDYNPPRPFKAGGSAASGVKTIYYALVSGSTFTPATTSDLHIRVGAALN